MAPTKKLSTQVEQEGKFVSMVPGRISLRPKSTRTVQTVDGGFATIEEPGLFYECEGERRNGSVGRMLKLDNPRDKEILEAFEDLLNRNPWMASDQRFRIEIIGEHHATRPWQGYDEQTAEEARDTYKHMPDVARPKLAEVMKYELNRTRWDEDLEEDVDATDPEKVKMLNELNREAEKAQKVASDDKLDLA